MSSEEKTEEPTSHKLETSRKRGEIASSKDLTGAFTYLAAFLAIWLGAGYLQKHLNQILSLAFDLIASPKYGGQTEATIVAMLVSALWVSGPILLVAALVGVLVGLLQTRGVFSVDPLIPKFERLNPGEALKQLFSTRQLGVLIQMILKVLLLVALLVGTIKMFIEPLMLGVYGVSKDAGTTGMIALYVLFGGAALVFIVLGIVDFLQQHFEYIKQNKMSKSERKRETKDNDGDPLLKAELRVLRREMVNAAPRQGLREANVLVTNPTHFAIALYYEQGVVELPVVLAKGQDEVALQMRAEAGRYAIPIMENPPLARALYASVALGQNIGDEHVEAVAEVFRWLNRLKSADG
ncbi:MAG: EscU/YscU/HrcU family type III secretion system export apparatus switch protein [Polaromonas sp.]|nr:EscU/YscU/HrcU family type III secretion system export apparatus switch protein [Polaromonas sp.]